MVKRARVLADVEVEADVPYERTRLARRAVRARPRLAVLLLVGAAGFLLEAALAREAMMLLGAGALAFTAWGAWKGRLGGVIAAALVGVLAMLVPLALMVVIERSVGERVIMAFVALWGAAMLPDVLTLVRDAELQHAYGRWARRAE